jgi:hypothetical protein
LLKQKLEENIRTMTEKVYMGFLTPHEASKKIAECLKCKKVKA